MITEGINTQEYTVTGLTQGLTYKFKVQARNNYGFSVYSAEVTILAAQVPAKPNTPLTTFIDIEDNVVISW